MKASEAHDLAAMQRTLGRIKGQLSCIQAGQHELHEEVRGIDGRLRRIEVRSATVATVVATGCSALAHSLGIIPGPVA